MKNVSTRFFRLLAALGLALAAGAATPADTPKAVPRDPQGLDTRVQSLKQEAMEINRDLLVLEEELLFPASTQVAVFVSVDVGVLFDLDSVELGRASCREGAR